MEKSDKLIQKIKGLHADLYKIFEQYKSKNILFY